MKLRAGDVVVLRGNLAAMPETLGELHCLPLAERDLRIGRKASLVPILVLAAAMGLVAFNVLAGGDRVFRRGGRPVARPVAQSCARPMTPSNGRSSSCWGR